MEFFNAIMLALFAIVAVAFLVITAPRDWGAGRVARLSLRARLPLGSASTERSIRSRARTLTRVNMWALLVALAAMGAMLLLTPLGESPYFLLFVAITILLGVLTISTAVVNTRERLFSPAPAAPRIARVRSVSTEEYIGRPRALLPVVLLGVAAVLVPGVVAAVLAGWLAVDWLPWLAAACMLTAGAVIVVRVAERCILAQPQPASDTVELAWDDLFRADALSTLRMGAAMAAWLTLGLAGALLLRAGLPFASSAGEAVLGLFPWWGIPALQVLYTLRQGRLPDRLYPVILRGPRPAGGAA